MTVFEAEQPAIFVLIVTLICLRAAVVRVWVELLCSLTSNQGKTKLSYAPQKTLRVRQLLGYKGNIFRNEAGCLPD